VCLPSRRSRSILSPSSELRLRVMNCDRFCVWMDSMEWMDPQWTLVMMILHCTRFASRSFSSVLGSNFYFVVVSDNPCCFQHLFAICYHHTDYACAHCDCHHCRSSRFISRYLEMMCRNCTFPKQVVSTNGPCNRMLPLRGRGHVPDGVEAYFH
jgi:hypothetical protein